LYIVKYRPDQLGGIIIIVTTVISLIRGLIFKEIRRQAKNGN